MAGNEKAPSRRERAARFARQMAINFTVASLTAAATVLVCAWWFGPERVFDAELQATLRPYILSLPLVALFMTLGGAFETSRSARRKADGATGSNGGGDA